VKWPSLARAPPPLPAWNVMLGLGVQPENVFVCDSKGLIYAGRPAGFDESKGRFAQATGLRTLADVVAGPTCSWAARPPAC
jgi:malate dehydrogenase (oxaloacetate-decarboxylating)(NADP+)